MRRIVSILMAAMLLLGSFSYAAGTKSLSNEAVQAVTMSKADLVALKEAGIELNRVAVLDNGEMAKTEGEFWGWFFRAILIFLAGSETAD